MENNTLENSGREKWGSRIGFIFAAASWSIGLGNIWRFPYITGQYGGAAFLIMYILIAIVLGVPLMVIEYYLGRKSQSSPLTGGAKLTKNKVWWLGGIFGFIGGLMIFSYYVMIIGWVLQYFISFFTGEFKGQSVEAISESFSALTANTGKTIGLELVILLILFLIVARGLKRGVEAVAKIAMPAMVILFLGLAVYSWTLPGAIEGLKFYLVPDFSKLSFEAMTAAIGQVFLSIGVGQGASWVYGSYLDKKSDIPTDVTQVTFMDTGFAFIAGLVIFPMAFSIGVEPNAGFGLLFKTLPSVFGTMTGGTVIGILFFFAVLVAAMTSAMAFAEAISCAIMDFFGWDREKKRGKAVVYTLLLTFVLSLISIFANGSMSGIHWFGMDMFTFMDTVSANIFLILAGLLMSLYVGWGMDFDEFMAEVNEGATKIKVQKWWKPLIKYVVPAIILVNFIATNF